MDVLAGTVLGKDPTRISQAIYEINRDAYRRGGPVSMTALSALEMAMWDVSARALGVPTSNRPPSTDGGRQLFPRPRCPGTAPLGP